MSNKDYLSKTLTEDVLSRRSFLKWSAAMGGTLALAGGVKYGLKAVEAAQAEPEGKWIPAACWHNCGGKCINVAYVVDGIVTKQKTDDSHEDSPDFPQQRGCARGRSQRQQVFGADRLKYPMKRKNWSPGGGKKELRGKDDWVRISWEEALDSIAQEMTRIKENYGNEAILAPWGSRLLNAFGGAMTTYGMVSYGAWPQVNLKTRGILMGGANDRMQLRNAKLLVMWGSNPAWSNAGLPSYNYLQAKKAGAKVISVDPFFNPSATLLADEWVPVRPSTDGALALGMAYHMIENGLQDQAFLDKYTVGFDAEHMPEGADPQKNFKDYVLGTYDGVPKTPEWASKICGTHPRTIRLFTEQFATIKPMSFMFSRALGRTYMGEQSCHAILTVGWMTGNVGLPGAMVGNNPGLYSNRSSYGDAPTLVVSGPTGISPIPNPLCADLMEIMFMGLTPEQKFLGIVWDEAWDAVVKGEFTNGRKGKQKCDIHMIWGIGEASPLNQMPNINQGIEAFRKVDFVVGSGHFLTSHLKYSDIVLPATTQWERWGGVLSGNPEMLIFFSQIVPPLYEAKDDGTANLSTNTGWVERELAKRLGIDPELVDPMPLKQQVFNQVAGATVIKADGSGYEPLVTITEKDLEEFEVTGKPQEGRISFKEYKEKGVYQVPRSPDDHFGAIAYQAFRDDPDANPIKTASGKLEIYSQALSDAIAGFGWTDKPPLPEYHPPVEGYEATFADWEGEVKGDYPLQLITIHYPRRSHSVFDNIPQLRKAFPQEFFLNSLDAEKRGIKTGDTVIISNSHGKVLRRACVTNNIMPGVTLLGEGAWVDKDDETGIDKAGATNSLSGTNPTGQGVQPWNTCIVQVEKWTGEPLEADYKWPQRIPIKEA